ncbi:hypothetical protein BKA82DRAFT_34057 [Pisolithus tinctorius]|nr:hypothetical protein BKA82DRAFT_34057 [Pisolithus tinctorius]
MSDTNLDNVSIADSISNSSASDDDPIVDEGQHDAPFDVAEVPQQLATGGPHAQVDVHLALYPHHPPADSDHLRLFNAHRLKHVSFRTFSPDLVPRLSPHYLDYALYVSSHHGLDAVLPNVTADHNWTAKLQLTVTFRLWPDNAANALPFNPKGRMMYVGTRLDDQFWLAIVPHVFFDIRDPDNRPNKLPLLDHRHPVIAPHHAHMIVMFITHVLSEMRHEDIHCLDPYPEPLTWDAVKDSTEVMGHFSQSNRMINLCLPDLFCLHQGFIDLWHAWVATAPRSWKQDGFLTANAPVTVSLCYGQNQPLMVSQSIDLKHMNWNHDQNYAHIRHISFSLATHISYLAVEHWTDIAQHMIMDKHPILYDKSDDDPSCLPVNLDELPLLDEHGFEINVYNEDGFWVPRRSPAAYQACGALLDLKQVHELFQGNEDAYGHVNNESPCTVYPPAFTRDLGNVKAAGLMPAFTHRLEHVDHAIQDPDADADLDIGDGDDAMPDPHMSPAIIRISSQIYNSLSHHVRTEAKFHVVQRGMVTSAFSGTGTKTRPARRRWQKRVQFCEQGLPHDRLRPDLCNGSIACYASEISLQVYFDNVKQFMFSKVSEELNDLLRLNDNIVRHAARDWFMALVRWKDEPCPLSYNQGVLSNLLLAIMPSDAGKFDLTMSVLGQRPVTFFVETIITQCAHDGHRKLPFIHTGNFFHVTNIAIDEIKAIVWHAGIPPLHEHRFMVNAFCCACEALKINHVPWSPNPANRVGRPSTMVVHDVWLNLGAKALSLTMNSSTLSQSNSALLMAQQASVQIQSSDPHSDWSAINI